MFVLLTAAELREAEDIGRQRFEYNRSLGKSPGCDKPLQNDIEGAIGEKAFCKWSGEPWSGFQLNYSGIADAGTRYEIRSTPHRYGNLLLHDTDRRDRVFVLARLHRLPSVELVGWILGRYGISAAFAWMGKDNKRPCYRFPHSLLRPMEDIPK